MKRLCFILVLIFMPLLTAHAQTDRGEVRRGNREYKKGVWAEADIHYRKALVKDSTSVAAQYNLSNNLYRQENYDEAARRLDKLSADSLSSGRDVEFNRGDVAIAQKDWQKAVDSFRRAMLADPDDLEAKENYAYAKQMLQDQQQNGGGGGQDDQQQNQQDKQEDSQDNQDNQDDKQNQDDRKQDDQSQDNGQNQPDQGDGGGEQPQISQQQAQQMLKALQAQDEKTQEKVRAEKAKALKTKQKEKNW